MCRSKSTSPVDHSHCILALLKSARPGNICRNHFSNTGGDAILVENGTTDDTTIFDNAIHDSGGWGINVGVSSTNALIHDNIFGNNTSGDIQDGGATTIDVNNVEWAKHSIATEARLAELDAANLPADLDALIATGGVAAVSELFSVVSIVISAADL